MDSNIAWVKQHFRDANSDVAHLDCLVFWFSHLLNGPYATLERLIVIWQNVLSDQVRFPSMESLLIPLKILGYQAKLLLNVIHKIRLSLEIVLLVRNHFHKQVGQELSSNIDPGRSISKREICQNWHPISEAEP